MVNVAQLVRALDCGSKGRGFESHLSPQHREKVYFSDPGFCEESKVFYMVNVAQLVRALDCGSKGRGFESHLSPVSKGCSSHQRAAFFMSLSVSIRGEPHLL